jgi:hypothetical protein
VIPPRLLACRGGRSHRLTVRPPAVRKIPGCGCCSSRLAEVSNFQADPAARGVERISTIRDKGRGRGKRFQSAGGDVLSDTSLAGAIQSLRIPLSTVPIAAGRAARVAASGASVSLGESSASAALTEIPWVKTLARNPHPYGLEAVVTPAEVVVTRPLGGSGCAARLEASAPPGGWAERVAPLITTESCSRPSDESRQMPTA